jgi:preprotein translocase subunit SecA
MSFLTRIFGDENASKIKGLQGVVTKAASLEGAISALSDEALKAKTVEFRDRLKKGESLNDLLPEAFATVREASKRTLGQRHFDVQIMGGAVLHSGAVAEMKTGEGKTLVATLPVYLNALSGEGAHVVTVNDYLARRDTVLMGQIYNFLGLSVGVINSQASYIYDPSHTNANQDETRDEEGGFRIIYEFLRPCSRREAYATDITYGTNNEFGFDYLRDNIAKRVEDLSQRTDSEGRYNFAIVDEVDSILIDESRTPLIISAPAGKSGELYKTCASIASSLVPEVDYEVDEKFKSIALTDEGISKAEKMLGVENIYSAKGVAYVHHLETAVKAKALYEINKDYVIKDGEVVIVDEFTGRLQPGRRWSEGLHQAIEAKEGVTIKEESRTYATVTLQNYFRLYRKLSGMTGTAMTSKEEFMKVYGLDTVSMPTNKPSTRIDKTDFIFQTEQGKFKALARRVKELQTKGQPVLIGTVSIEKNELLSAYLTKEGVRHQVLNAKNHEQEGLIIAEAGKKGGVTVATNMAGRGIDIKLGGSTPTEEESAQIKELGGLAVIGTERHEARRIDNQLRGRSGRQGDPGETQFYISLEDSLMRIFAPERIKNMMGRLGIPEDEPIENSIVSKSIENAQSKIEGMHFDVRKHLLEYDDVINHQRVTMYARRREVLVGGQAGLTSFLNRAMEVLGFSDEESVDFWKTFNDKKEKITDGDFVKVVQTAVLQIIDMYWLEHLEAIDHMKSSVKLRAYGQRDPLVEFKREGLNLFKGLEASIFNEVLKTIPNIEVNVLSEEKVALQEVHESTLQPVEPKVALRDNQTLKEVGRNDPCPCGSGKKYKKCHGM